MEGRGIVMKRIDKLNIEEDNRGLLFIRITDRYGNKIRVKQSSVELTDVWFFIDEVGVLGELYNDILLTYDNVKDINAFVSYLREGH
jgi:hypothetical protein